MRKLEDGQAYKNKIEYIKGFNKESYKVFCFRFNKKYDAKIIEFLERCPNKQGLIKELLQNEMNKSDRPDE